jgi:hypothetical protein
MDIGEIMVGIRSYLLEQCGSAVLISVGVGWLAHGLPGLPGLQLVVPLVHGPFIYISKVVAMRVWIAEAKWLPQSVEGNN